MNDRDKAKFHEFHEFKVGDEVIILDNIPEEWWFKPGDLAIVDEIIIYGLDSYRIRFPDRNNKCGTVDGHEIEPSEANSSRMNSELAKNHHDYYLAITEPENVR